MVHVISGHRGPSGQNEDTLCEDLRYRQERPCLGKARSIGFHPMTTGIKIPPRQDIFSLKDLQKLISADLSDRLIDLQDDVLIVALLRFVECHEADSRYVCQLGSIALVIAVVGGYELFETFQSGQSHCRRGFAHLPVCSY